MKAHLLFPDRDFDSKADPPPQWPVVARDLEVDTLLAAMAQGDAFLLDVAARTLMAACGRPDTSVTATPTHRAPTSFSSSSME